MDIKKIHTWLWELMDKNEDKRLKQQEIITNGTVSVIKDIPYDNKGTSTTFDMYFPKGKQGKLPIIINIPGGGYTVGKKENNRLQSEIFANKGFCVLTINYRRIDEAKFPAPIIDLFKMFKYVESNFSPEKFDTKNILLMGDSAGAHIGALGASITKNKELQEKFGVSTDITVKGCAFFSASFKVPTIPLANKSYQDLIYGQENLHFKDATSVLKNMTSNFPPNVVVSPINDFMRKHSLVFKEKCKRLGVESHFISLKSGKGLGHISMIKYSNDESYHKMFSAIASFLKEKFKETNFSQTEQ